MPGLRLTGTPSVLVLGGAALVVTYGAYIAEVFRAGIESVHPCQRAAARSLGLTYRQTMRHVVLPQAVRRVAPPLLNDLVALQKDVGLISLAGPIDAIRAAQIPTADTYNYTPYIVAGVLFVLLAIPLIAVTDWVTVRAARRRQSASSAGMTAVPSPCCPVWTSQGVRRLRGARRTRPRRGRARGGGADRRVRLGQVDAAALREPAGDLDDGTIHLDGEHITDPRVNPDLVRRRIGIVFQAYNLFPHLTRAGQHHPRAASGAPARRGPRPRSRRWRCSTGSAWRTRPTSTRTGSPAASSSGSRSSGRWSTRPRLLLLDEVTSALDPELVGEVLALIRDLKDEGMTMVHRHARDELRPPGGRPGLLPRRRPDPRAGPPEQVFDEPTEARTQQFLRRLSAA